MLFPVVNANHSHKTAACGFWFGLLFPFSLPSSAWANKLGSPPGLWGTWGEQAALSSCPGKPQWGVRESRTQLSTCPIHLWEAGWGSLCWEMGMVQSWVQALGIEHT